MIKISYAITVKDELDELVKLLNVLLKYKGDNEIVVVRDTSFNDPNVAEFLQAQNDIVSGVFEFKNNFSDLKNYMNSICNGEWIFNIDADEIPNETLLESLNGILDMNSDLDAIWVPRINIVNGITPEHISNWHWSINERGWINWPNDAQCRIYKNCKDIKWVGVVHEHLDGAIGKISKLPDMEEFSLYHIKDIARQEKQNNYYSQLN